MSDMTDLATAASAIIDPATSAADLAIIAEVHPSLRTAIALHPAAYPGLLDWLDALGDPVLSAAVASRRASDTQAAQVPVAVVQETKSNEAGSMDGVGEMPHAADQPVETRPQQVRMRIPVDSRAPLIAGIVLIIGAIPGLLCSFGFFGFLELAYSMFDDSAGFYVTMAVFVFGVVLCVFAFMKRFVPVISIIIGIATASWFILWAIASVFRGSVYGIVSAVCLILALLGVAFIYKGSRRVNNTKTWKTIAVALLGVALVFNVLNGVFETNHFVYEYHKFSQNYDFYVSTGKWVLGTILMLFASTASLVAIGLLVSSLSSDPSKKYYEPRPRTVRTPAMAVTKEAVVTPVPLYTMVVMPDGTQQMMPVAQQAGMAPIGQTGSLADAPKRQVGMWGAYRWFWKKYAQFSGRASVKEYWWVVLAQVIVTLPVTALSVIGAVLADDGEDAGFFMMLIAIGLIGLYSLAVIVPNLALIVRRLHDTGRPWPYMLIALIPLVGAIIVIVFCAQQGTVGANMYGPDDSGY